MNLFTRIEHQLRHLIDDPTLAIEGAAQPGAPARLLPLAEVADLLDDPATPRAVRDPLWQALATAEDRDIWDTACLGLALPALRRCVTRAARIWPYDLDGLQSAAANAALEALHEQLPAEGAVFSRMYTRAKAAARTHARDLARHTRAGVNEVFESTPPLTPWGHVDLVLIKAVREGAITKDEADIITALRLDRTDLRELAETMNTPRLDLQLRSKQAEYRLAEWIITG